MKRRIALATLAAFAAVGGGTAMAAEITYTGPNGAWTTATNWSGGSVPGSGDTAIIPSTKQVTLDTAVEVVEGAFEIYEGEQKESLPEQAVAWLKCGLKVIDKVLPVNLTPTEAVEETLDQGLDHARNQRDYGSINSGVRRQLAEIGM